MKLKKTFAKIIFNFIYNQKTVSNFVEFLFAYSGLSSLPSPFQLNPHPERQTEKCRACLYTGSQRRLAGTIGKINAYPLFLYSNGLIPVYRLKYFPKNEISAKFRESEIS